MSGTIDQAVERERDEDGKKKQDARQGPAKTGPADDSLPDDKGASATPNQPRSTPMAGQKP